MYCKLVFEGMKVYLAIAIKYYVKPSTLQPCPAPQYNDYYLAHLQVVEVVVETERCDNKLKIHTNV